MKETKRIKVLFDYPFNMEGFQKLDSRFELIYPKNKRYNEEEVASLLSNEDIQVYVANLALRVGKEVLENAKALKLIVSFGVGYDHIDVPYATSKGIIVANTPYSVLNPTVETAFALLLATARRLGYFNNRLHKGERVDWTLCGDLGTSIDGSTLGIFGMGRIGREIAKRANVFGMKVLYHNRKQLSNAEEKELGVEYVDFSTLLQQSDFLSLNAPYTSETHHVINADTLSKMKKSAYLINTARGGLVDEKALIYALQNKQIAGVGLDVYENEPKISPELLGLENVVLTPHMGTKTEQARFKMQVEVAENILNFYEGKKFSKVN